MIIIKNQTQIEGIRQSSKLAAVTLKYLSRFVKPGISTEKLNELGHKFIIDHDAIPAPLNYSGFPKSICTSINNVVCHGIPSPNEILKEGDIINLDVTTILNGYYGDVSASFPVGKITKKAQDLIETTKYALNQSIKCLKPGKLLNNCVGKVIEPIANKKGYSIVRELGGHGVGLSFHEDPFIFHFDTNQEKVILKEGMIFTIEPMINASTNYRVTLDRHDGWTIRTLDGSLSAQFEHTVLITKTGYEILTI
ncbi:MAG: type I methionyl aminopeptidase [Candidatus Shapirobacteria bacterium]|nr:type I methionyl aminopeptidase [Candidatus Shapirobacteria bacterium]MDD4410796.1 type I methionyl aminopeptidase [Candidatus Shapirobacteria bacterium]